MQTARVTVLMTPEKKAELAAKARRRGVSTGEFLRLAAENLPNEAAEEEELGALVQELAAAVPEMRASLERSAQRLEDTSREVDAMLREAGIRK